jgi:flagellar M-ring protein FliF
MPNAFAAIRDQFARIWGNMGRVQKISVGVILLVAVVSLAVFVITSSRPSYVTVFSNLNEQDASAIVTKLKQSKVPYETADGGKTIKVPRDQADDVRLSVAAAGLPASGAVGYEIFDKTNFSTTDFNNKVNLQRALEGELDRTISRLDGVQSATVHLVMPEQALFQQQQQPTTASVALQLKSGVTLTNDQTKAITKLVSSSVEGLKPENVTVVDQNGTVLTDLLAGTNSPQAVQQVTQQQLKMQHDLEQQMQTDLQSMLDRVLGPGQSVVKVTAPLDWDQFQSTSELFSPGNRPAIVRSQRQITENFQGSGTPPIGGVPGTESNVPTYQGAIAAGGPSQYSKTDNTQNFEISKSIEQLQKTPGAIKRLTVAAMVNTPLDQAGVDSLTRSLQAAAGYDANRGDVVTVTSLAFNNATSSANDAALAARQRQELIQRIIEGAGVALVALVLLFFFRSLVMSLRPAEVELLPVPLTVGELAGEGLPPLSEEELMMAQAAAAGVDMGALAAQQQAEEEAQAAALAAEEEEEQELLVPEMPVDPEAEARRRVLQERMRNLARTRPDVVARLLQTWINERR